MGLIFHIIHQTVPAKAGTQVLPFQMPLIGSEAPRWIVVRRLHIEDAADEFIFQIIRKIRILVFFDGAGDLRIPCCIGIR